jgi:hypothetical protein
LNNRGKDKSTIEKKIREKMKYIKDLPSSSADIRKKASSDNIRKEDRELKGYYEIVKNDVLLQTSCARQMYLEAYTEKYGSDDDFLQNPNLGKEELKKPEALEGLKKKFEEHCENIQISQWTQRIKDSINEAGEQYRKMLEKLTTERQTVAQLFSARLFLLEKLNQDISKCNQLIFQIGPIYQEFYQTISAIKIVPELCRRKDTVEGRVLQDFITWQSCKIKFGEALEEYNNSRQELYIHSIEVLTGEIKENYKAIQEEYHRIEKMNSNGVINQTYNPIHQITIWIYNLYQTHLYKVDQIKRSIKDTHIDIEVQPLIDYKNLKESFERQLQIYNTEKQNLETLLKLEEEKKSSSSGGSSTTSLSINNSEIAIDEPSMTQEINKESTPMPMISATPNPQSDLSMTDDIFLE